MSPEEIELKGEETEGRANEESQFSKDDNVNYKFSEISRLESSQDIEKNSKQRVRRRFPPNQFLKFSSLVLVPGKPRKWKRVQRRFGRNEGAWLYRWEYIPESIDHLFMENLELIARGVVGPRRTGRTTRAVSFHMRENTAGSSVNAYELEGSYDQSGQGYSQSSDLRTTY
ncbi:hypothetical protein HWI79_3648 [Cryptosporidium felis]|nr:hypothetical protein HWI79_3648 [Cryptosporidium felis]